MTPSDLRAELSVKMIELERAIDTGLPYPDIRRIYSEIKELQLQCIFADLYRTDAVASESDDLVVE